MMPAPPRKMVIQRIRNPEDRSQWVDVADTVEITVEHGSGVIFTRTVFTFQTFYIADPSDRSEPFEVTSDADLRAARDAFAASHPK
jgi:hypothetical protein